MECAGQVYSYFLILDMLVSFMSSPIYRWEIPRRSYTEEGVVAVFIPLVMLLILAALLTAVLGVHPEGAEPEEGQVKIFLFLFFFCIIVS